MLELLSPQVLAGFHLAHLSESVQILLGLNLKVLSIMFFWDKLSHGRTPVGP
jgi:hypothetical protein